MAQTLLRLRQIRADQDDQLSGTEIADLEFETQEELQRAVLSQLRRLIWGDGSGSHWNSDFVVSGISTLQQLTRGRFYPAKCQASDSVGQAVRALATSTGDRVVRHVNPFDPTLMPAVGLIVDKPAPTATTCLVQTLGDVALGALSPGKIYVVGGDGRPTATLPMVTNAGQYVIVQALGIALDEIWLDLRPSLDLQRRGFAGG